MTPPARWRPSGLPSHAFVIGPATCQDCGGLVWFGRSLTRVQGAVVLGEVQTWREWGRYAVHSCLASRARAWDNERAGTSSIPVQSPTDAASLLVPGEAASSRSRQELDAR